MTSFWGAVAIRRSRKNDRGNGDNELKGRDYAYGVGEGLEGSVAV
jgi:hypothetical protein